MALISCPECGCKVSTQAKACPECGYVISHPISSNGQNQLALAILILMVLLGLLFTNPDKEEFISHIKTELSKAMNNSIDLTPVAKAMASGITSLYLNSAVTRTNYGIFSIYKLDLTITRMLVQDAPDRTFIGIASMVIPLGEPKTAEPPTTQVSECEVIATYDVSTSSMDGLPDECITSNDINAKPFLSCPTMIKMGETMSLASQHIFIAPNGKQMYCEHGGYCYPKSAFRTYRNCSPKEIADNLSAEYVEPRH